LNSIIVKELEQKSVVWFQPSNQYLLLEPTTASIIKAISEKKEIKKIATELENELDIPFEKAIDFILDLEEKIIKPNTEVDLKPSVNGKNYDAPKSFGYTKYYLMYDKTFKVKFSSEFEVSLIHPKFAHLEVPTISQPDYHILVFNHSNYTYLVMNDELIGSWSKKEIHYFQGKFSMKIIESIYEKLEENWMGVFHASALSRGKNSILMLGDSGNGKSTSLALLQANGFNCVADDFVPIDHQKAVHSFPAGISIKKNSLPVLLPFYPELENSAEYHYKRLNKTVRYLPPKNVAYETTYPCKALVFIKYDQHVEFELEKVTNEKAFEYLIPDSWISQKPENVVIFLDWFSSLPCYQLTYSNNQKMMEEVGKILNNES
jgi:hypothetical protein